MIDFLNLFFDVFLFPIDPANLDFENNVIMIILSLCLIGIGFSRSLLSSYNQPGSIYFR